MMNFVRSKQRSRAALLVFFKLKKNAVKAHHLREEACGLHYQKFPVKFGSNVL